MTLSSASLRRFLLLPKLYSPFLLIQPKHPEIDGSGMLRSAASSGAISGVGDTFTMQMHNEEMGDYEMIKHVGEYQAWRVHRPGTRPLACRAGGGQER